MVQKHCRKLLLLLLLLPSYAAWSQALTIEQCYSMARENYPLIKRYDLIKATGKYSLSNAGKVYLPQVNFSGQATYQSDVVNAADLLPANLGVSFPSFSKDQYKLVGEVQQTIFDANASHYQKELIKANTAADQQNLEVSLYTVRERINQFYFSILLMDEQLKQNDIRTSDLNSAIAKVEAAYRNGAAYRSNVDELKAELSNARSSDIQFRSNRSAYMKMLGVFIGKELDDNTKLVTPDEQPVPTDIHRPELTWYQYRRKTMDVQELQLKSDYLPRFNAFFQGAYGRPTLNFLSNDFGWWYMTGLRMSWNLGSLYSLKNNKHIIENNRKSVAIEEETFLYNTNISLIQQREELKKFHAMIAEDQEAITYRSSVKQSAKAQLENGVITVHDYINQLNAENQARQTLILHQLQLLQAGYQYKYTSGN
ncbi:TolC family protein [Chitinophaga sp. Hz27]|uniref:TolC family protein n=1 Tax=Chitinophaga sp. Hz27 TaxID=3347169 RepID=UPI0035D864A5